MTIRHTASIGLHLVLALAAPGFAQDVAAQDSERTFPVGRYRVRMQDGATLRGQLQRMSPETLRNLVAGQSREVPMRDVETVDRPTHLALGGLLIGAAAGVLLGAVSNCKREEYNQSNGTVATKTAVGCVASAGGTNGIIGLGIGWLFSRPSIFYRRAPSGTR